MIKRIIALTAVLLLILPLCAGCNNKKGRGVGGEKLLRPDLEPEHVDFEGHEFIVADFNGGRWQRQEESNPYNDAWQRVLDNVEQNFNCTINFHQTSPGGVWDEAYPEIAAGEKYADIICATKWHFGKLLGSDLMLDLNLLSTNWNNIWWNQNIRKISTIKDKTYAGGGSFIFDAVYTWILNFNFDIWRELQLPDPYELVQNGEWTIDLLIEYSKKAMMDKDGTGIVDSADDRWGLIGPGGDFARALYQGGGNTFFEEKNGRLQMGCQGTQTFDFVDKMRKMYMQDKSMGRNFKDFKVSDYARMFINGNALFFAYMPGLPDLREMDTEWGVLPLPKASKEQEQYMSGVDHNATVFGVTKTNADLDKVGILLDALGYYALELELIYWPDYEETYWWHEQDARIVADYICKSAQYDMALLMQNVDNVFRIPMDLVNGAMFGGITDFSSMVESQKDKVNKTLDKFFMDWERDAEK